MPHTLVQIVVPKILQILINQTMIKYDNLLIQSSLIVAISINLWAL